jgi:uncharacterized protein (DUF58 family)
MRRQLLTFTPEPRLALIVVLLAPLWLVPGTLGRVAVIGMFAALALAIVGDAIALPAASDIHIERALPPSIGIGDHMEGEYVVRSRWGMRLHTRLADDLPAGVTGGAYERDLAVPARGLAHLAVPIVGAVRGRYALGG